MNSVEATKVIIEKYPDLFVNDKNIAVYAGWFKIVDDALEKLQEENVLSLPNKKSKIMQIKEKFGVMRMYITNTSETKQNIIFSAESNSRKTCMVCGEEGVLREYKWRRTLCNEHAESFLV